MIVDIRKSDAVVTGLYQYDYGQTLEFTGKEISDGTQVHFFKGDYGCRAEVNDGIAKIPDYLFTNSDTVLAYLYVADGIAGKTIQRLTILILPREKPPDYVDPTKPADYSRLLPLGGSIGDLLVKTENGYTWRDLDDEFVTDDELQKVSEKLPVAMTVQDVLSICKV
ncbi:hypothetical protein [Lacrimispora sp.]|uniref:hypothetical protein n=1 Tax=Lacrimispora sp. TaxID=2719234 RepID=UPI0034606897